MKDYRICLTCKHFSRVTEIGGFCALHPYTAAVGETCDDWDGEIGKIAELYFEGKSLEEAINIIKKSCRSS